MMEFNEKLQELRKSRGLTQEKLAEDLFVSRTAISKWESGRGYPSIDSLKEISKYFSVTIDDLLSCEKILSIAENESKSSIRSICDLLFGISDLMTMILLILPLYPKTVGDHVYSVNLFAYTELSSMNRLIYWLMFAVLIAVGGIKVVLNQMKIEKGQKIITSCSLICSVAAVLFLAATRETYAIVITFLLLVIKTVLILKRVTAN